MLAGSGVSSVKKNRQDPPREEWPGRAVRDFAEERVSEACGDPKDIFTFEQRLKAHRWLERAHWYNWRLGKRPRYKFKLIFLVGKKGQGKSLTAIYHAAQLYAAGLPFFHNGSGLFGNELNLLDMFDLIDRGPTGGCFWFDEIHTINQTNRELSTAQVTQVESIAGMRKKDYWGTIGTSIPGLVGRRMRSQVDEIWMPNKLEVKYVGGRSGSSQATQAGGMGSLEQYLSWDHPSPSVQSSVDYGRYLSWEGKSTKGKRALAEGRAPRRKACDNSANFQYIVNKLTENPWSDNSIFGLFDPSLVEKPRKGEVQERPPYVRLKPSWVRLSMMLLDSFIPLKLGAGAQASAMTKEMKQRLFADDGVTDSSGGGPDASVDYMVATKLLESFESGAIMPDDNGYCRAQDMITQAGLGAVMTAQGMGALMGRWQIPKGSGRKGYESEVLYDMLASTLRGEE